MKNFYLKLIFISIISLNMTNVNSQCVSTDEFTTIALSSHNQSESNPYCRDGYYNVLEVNNIGTINLTFNGYYITLTDASNTVLAHGGSSFNYTFTSTGNYRIHFFMSGACDFSPFNLWYYDYLFTCPQVDLVGEVVEDRELNDGSIANSVSLKHSLYNGDKFTGTNGEDYIGSGKVTVTNLPTGLAIGITKTDDATLTVNFTSNASNHANLNDISNLTFTFANTAFTTYQASETVNSNMNNVAVEFIEEHTVGSSGDFSTIAAAIAGADNYDILNLQSETFVETNLVVDKSLRFKGSGAKNTIISGHNDYDAAADRIFTINNNLSVEFLNLTLKNGRKNSGGAAIYCPSFLNLLSLENCIIKDNVGNADEAGSTTTGGAIRAYGGVSIKNCLFDNNIIRHSSGGNAGGAISIFTESQALVENCTFTNNIVYNRDGNGSAGALSLSNNGNNTSTIRNCTFTNNGIDNSGSPGGTGGAMYLNHYNSTTSTIDVQNCIIYGNSAVTGSDFYESKSVTNTSCVFNVNNTIYQSVAFSTEGGINGTNSGNLTSDPLLVNLTDNGGQMNTVAISTGSPAINAGLITNAPATDHRGFNRDGQVDIGAYEYGACGVPTVSSSTAAARCGSGAITLSATPSGGATIKWFTASTGGSAILDDADYDLSGNDLTINNLSTTTAFFAEATMFSCVSASRTSVTATVNTPPTISSPVPASRCGTGSITLSATPSAGAVKWFTTSTLGTAIVDDANYDLSGNDLTIVNLASTTSFYAEADNSGCVSAARTEVIATVNIGGPCYSGGAGTSPDPFLIASKADLKYLSENTGEWTKFFKQIANISFIATDFQSGGDFYNSGSGFNQIGYGLNQFTGTYDGDNYSIDGLTMTRSGQGQVGMFGLVGSGSDLKNIKLTNVSISGNFHVGALIGSQTSGNVTNCSSTGTITGVDYNVGGLIGESNGAITSCYSTASVNTARNCGGLIGRMNAGSVSLSYSTGTVTATGDYVGGLSGTNNGTISSCYSTSNVTGNEVVGGFVGMQSADLTNCYSSGQVTGLGAIDNGGFVGYYNTGTPTSCFWNTETSTFATSGGTGGSSGTGKTTTEMQTEATFTGASWNFTTIWKMDLGCPNNGHPIFLAQSTQARPTISSTTPGSRCGTGTVSLEASGSAGTLSWYAAATGGSPIGSTGSPWTSPSISTSTTYYVETVDGTCASLRSSVLASINDCSSSLDGGSCGKTLATLDETITSTAVTGATNFRYEVRLASNNSFVALSTKGNASNTFRLSWISGNIIKYGTTYNIRVASYVDGSWQTYSSNCTVTTPATKLQDAYCDATLSKIDDLISCYEVTGASNYRYEIRHLASGYYALSVKGNSNTNFRMSWVNGLVSGRTYQVRVSAYVGGSWRAYGATCSVTVPLLTTKLASGSCGTTVTNLDQSLNSITVVGAADYKYRVMDAGTQVGVSARGQGDNLFRLSWLTGTTNNKTYLVYVAVKIDGVWGAYGEACSVTTPAAMVLDDDSDLSKGASEWTQDVELSTFPNPNKGDFTITSSHEGQFQVTNQLGQLIQSHVITKENNYQTRVDGLSSGVYFITGIINDETVTRKVVVQ